MDKKNTNVIASTLRNERKEKNRFMMIHGFVYPVN
jgi:hypothetical protein